MRLLTPPGAPATPEATPATLAAAPSGVRLLTPPPTAADPYTDYVQNGGPSPNVLGASDNGPSFLGALTRSIGRGVVGNFDDEINAGIQALGQKILPESYGGGDNGKTLGQLYDENRAGFRQDTAADVKAYPELEPIGNAIGGLALAPFIPGGGLARTLATGAGIGALQSLGASGADLTKGDFGGALADTAAGAGAGLLGAGVGAGVGYGIGKLGQPLQKLGVALTKRTFPGANYLSNEAAEALQASGAIKPFRTPGMTKANVEAAIPTLSPGAAVNVSEALTKAEAKGGGLTDKLANMALGGLGGMLVGSGFDYHKLLSPGALTTAAVGALGPSTAARGVFVAGTGLQRIVETNPGFLGPAGAILANALRQSQSTYDAHVYALSQTSPEFQQRVKDLNESTKGQ